MKKILLFIKCLSIIIFFILIFYYFLFLIAFITPKKDIKNSNQLLFYDDKNSLVFTSNNNSKWVSYNDISKNIINATISVEDKSFKNHNGFDFLRIISALLKNIKHGYIKEGASTISQQYIKNLYLNFDKSWLRKIDEALKTIELETHYSKNEIIEGYLNTINYGCGQFGIENASNYYFNKSAKELTIDEASLLVGIPKSPQKYNPRNNYKNALKRRNIVLKSMYKNKIIDKKKYIEIKNKKIILNINKNKNNQKNINYYKDATIKELNTIKNIPKNLIKSGGLKIYTNLNLNSQSVLEKNTIKYMKNSDLQIASIIINPKNGKITALLGGRDYTKSEYNRITQAKRQVGSTIKPFLYYSALENGLTASSKFYSGKTTFNIDKNKMYSPKNYNNKYANKKICMTAAIAYSDNIYAVKTNLFLSKKSLINTLRKSGIKENIKYSPSLALGTKEINLLDYANGYQTLANEGIHNDIYIINKITDLKGNIIYIHKNREIKVLNNKYIYILNEMLTNTYNYNYINYISPTMISISGKITKKYAIKSGSTNTDFLTIGYNPNILMIVWNGYDNGNKVNSNDSKISKYIWADSVETILSNKKNTWYKIPNGISSVNVDPITGNPSNSNNKIKNYYITGTEPT